MLVGAESERWRQMLDSEQQTSMQLEELNQCLSSGDCATASCCSVHAVEHSSCCSFLSEDSKEVGKVKGNLLWVTSQSIHSNMSYWRTGEPNNVNPSWEHSQAGQDCVAIIPPTCTEDQDWSNSCVKP